ncbi:MAG: hypothetical protein B1H03_05585 [Planctomycetales bacterium 4484_113]|nr:MAG: hypothetical protein B1H03_05585 [Planctomycetales bacterium 4484_113]
MPTGGEKVDIATLIYPGQRVELDCAKLYSQLEHVPGPTSAPGNEAASGPVSETTPTTDAPVSAVPPAELPALVTGNIKQVLESQFSFAVPKLPIPVWDLLEPSMLLSLFIVDPRGMFSTESQLLRTNPAMMLIFAAHPLSGARLAHRRFIRVSIRGKAFLLHEKIEEGQREGSVVDLGGAGVRIRTEVSWLKPGEEMTLMIVTGFVDERKQQHVSLDLTVPARVVWVRQTNEDTEHPVFFAGFAFTEISIADQERLIGFLLAYDASRYRAE